MENIKYPEFSNLITKVRKIKNLNHSELAKILGKKRTTIVNYQAGRINIPGSVLKKLEQLAQKGTGSTK
jgi:ribosome-binding protein aMBF1 (putative translation factor)